MGDAGRWNDVGESAWGWVLAHLRHDDDDTLWLPLTDDDGQDGERDEFPDCTHSGIGGLAFVLAEIRLTRPWTDTEQQLARDIVSTIRRHVPTRTEPSYGLGLAGDATALRLLEPGQEDSALERLAELARSDGWATTIFADAPGCVDDLLLGNAGVALTALWAQHELSSTIATAACEALGRVAVEDETGLKWFMYEGYTGEMPNYSHGTTGIGAALATAGHRLGRRDWVEAAVGGARHVIALADEQGRSELGLRVPRVVPHLPRHDFDLYTWNWCHGPAGTSYFFLALHEAGVDDIAGGTPLDWHAHCLRALDTSGIPQRRKPGFWDNDGRCCGTAGAGDAYLDGAQARRDEATLAAHWLDQAGVMADALLDRAITDDAGSRWRFLEHRNDSPLLPPGTGWMQGAAGIAAFLLRSARVQRQGLDAPQVTRPDAMWI